MCRKANILKVVRMDMCDTMNHLHLKLVIKFSCNHFQIHQNTTLCVVTRIYVQKTDVLKVVRMAMCDTINHLHLKLVIKF